MSYFKCSKNVEKKLEDVCDKLFDLIDTLDEEQPDECSLHIFLRGIGNTMQNLWNNADSGDPEDDE